jgi:2-polyprenyl-3-methyl-5-hydroxy-6-metoxy-1,4-benzoquinol methylase
LGAARRAWLRLVIWLNAHFKSAAVRLTRATGKSRVPLHPKHLAGANASQPWYLDYVEPRMRVLDVGCGNGVHSIRVARRGAAVIGMDYDLGFLQTCKLLRGEGSVSTAGFVLGNVEHSLPFTSAQFDMAMLLDVLEHLDHRVELLHEIHRVLRPGGTLLVSVPNGNTRWKRRLRGAALPWYTDPDHRVEYDWDGLRHELHQGGFEPVGEPMPIVYDTPWAGLIDLTGGFSLALYRRLSRWKEDMARRHPEETIGWRVACRRKQG